MAGPGILTSKQILLKPGSTVHLWNGALWSCDILVLYESDTRDVRGLLRQDCEAQGLAMHSAPTLPVKIPPYKHPAALTAYKYLWQNGDIID